MKITMEGKYQTRDGRAVRILATDFKAGATCIIGAITMTDTNEIVGLWNVRGEEFGSFDKLDDLVPVPTKHEGWVIMGEERLCYTYKEDAESEAEMRRIRSGKKQVVVHVTWED